jgi:hypothetical protein
VRPGLREDGVRWTRELIVYAIDLWARRHLRAPTAEQWSRAGADHPSRQTVQRVFGTWNAAIAAAGYVPRRPGRPLKRAFVTSERRAAPARG